MSNPYPSFLTRIAMLIVVVTRNFFRANAFRTHIPSSSNSRLHSVSYEFLDCGDGLRFEKFGVFNVSRSCPGASSWRPKLTRNSWATAQLQYTGTSGNAGSWQTKSPLPKDEWSVAFEDGQMKFMLDISELGQVGVFPEQLSNWRWLRETIHAPEGADVKVLNGFAYTGGSTLAVLLAGPAVKATHLDAARSSVLWAKKNCEASGLGNRSVRWITDDCMTFLMREIKRNKKYEGLIFDPPAFGRSENKVWKLTKDLPILLDLLPSLLSPTAQFVLISCHDAAWPPQRLAEAVELRLRPFGGSMQALELSLESNRGGATLPCGSCVRWTFPRK